ncbi:MAG TPA: hypothetical protein DEH78_28690 [Solibacterales bacterium]|nr:hypothetical protein [Bryobacterales bacterium]
MTRFLQKLAPHVRPAPLAALLSRWSGLDRRRFVDTGQGRFWINPVSDLGTSLLSGEYEPAMRRVLEQYLRPGGTFVDLGANEGYFSVIASRLVGPEGSVVAVEPQSRLQTVIQRNLVENGCFNVQVFQCLLSGRAGTAKIALSSDMNTGGSSLFPAARYRLPQEELRTLTLDDFFSKLRVGHCDLMKVDIEGAEWDVFMNSADVLRSGRLRNIVLEIHDSILAARGLDGAVLHQHMLAQGYTADKELGPWVYRRLP